MVPFVINSVLVILQSNQILYSKNLDQKIYGFKKKEQNKNIYQK